MAQIAMPPPREIAIQMQFQRAVEHHQSGRFTEAASLYQQILHLVPEHADALHLLGVIALQRGQYPAAAELIRQALRIRPSQHYYANLGNALKESGALDDAIDCYRKALLIEPGLAEAHCNLGNALLSQGHSEEAIACCNKAIALKPDLAEAHSNLGNALRARGELATAIACYRRTLMLAPNLAQAHSNLGHALAEQGDLDEAIACYRRALAIKPESANDMCNLGNALRRQGMANQAIDSYLGALQRSESDEAKLGFIACIREAHFNADQPRVRHYVRRALTHAWAKPGDLLTPAKSLIECHPGIRACLERANQAWPQPLSKHALFGSAGMTMLADEPLLQDLLENVAINSIGFERLLTMTRTLMLDDAMQAVHSGAAAPSSSWDRLAIFQCALARQCFINDYVYACTDEELQKVAALRDAVSACVHAQLPLDPLWLVALAAYAPLATLACAPVLLQRPWPDALAAVFRQQVGEPEIERSYRASLPRLGPINDAVSRLVQTQYEENPYPKWVRIPQVAQASGIDALMRHQFPQARFQALGKIDAVDILVAGCGTGQHSIQTAQQFKGARVFAIDLSVSSLCYAKRKTDELGMTNVAYAQADIMDLGALERTFDVIESVGVLHHLADPLAGLKILLGLLRPGGFMCLGLYSEMARQDVVMARNHIAQQGYAATPADIRRCRQDLMANDSAGHFTQLLTSRDFFSISDCRDLLFHVQEQRYTMLQVKAMLAELDLQLIGFMVDVGVATQYAQQFPDDPARINLEYWHLFEVANPATFSRMYQFWVQKRWA